MKLFISPQFRNNDRADGGIRRVVDAMCRYLPDHGIEVVDNPDVADVINNHGAMMAERPGVPVVASNHGLYWHDYDWASWAHETNRQVIESMRLATAVTAPSRWVAHAISRGMMVRPEVIYHGVEIDEFAPDPEPADWILWNKARLDPISDPAPVLRLAQMAPDLRFVVTVDKQYPVAAQLDALPNVLVVDPMPYEEMKRYVAKASVYLATTRETFGIGTIEAMAAGVPVAGFAYGGQEEIVTQGETGYLVPFGQYERLIDAIRLCVDERGRLGTNARQDVRERWLWPDKVARYANIIQAVYRDRYEAQHPKVSVIVTCYNLSHFLDDCLTSVANQTMGDFECIMVDDRGTDDAEQVTKAYTDGRFRYLRTPENLGLSGARNYGLQHSRGCYIIHLDADDMFPETTLEDLSAALDADSSIHIAYGHLDTISAAGQNRQRNVRPDGRDAFPPAEYNWREQIAHLNQLHYAAMMRRRVLENCGGYRVRDWRAEDASFWIRATSYGFRARKVTARSTLIYRLRPDSKGAMERAAYDDNDGNWCAWYPFALASTAEEGARLKRRMALKPGSELATDDIVPWGAQGKPPRSWQRYRKWWNVRHYQDPAISVVIPVGPGHKQYVIDALDSLVAQDFQNWEAIVVNDSGEDWDEIPGAPYAKVVVKKERSADAKGAGEARNVGAMLARGQALLFLDADDYLLPGAMTAVWKEFDRNTVVYGDWLANTGGGEMQYYATYDFTCDIAKQDTEADECIVLVRPLHAVTCLVPAWAHYQVGGFHIGMEVWEDWDYQIRIYARLGLCGVRIPQAVLVYRQHTGRRRKVASVAEAEGDGWQEVYKANDKAKEFLYNEHRDYYKRRKTMACSKCPGGKGANPPTTEATTESLNGGDGMILQFHGPGVNEHHILGAVTRKRYKVKNTPQGRLVFNVDPADAAVWMQRKRKGQQLWTEFEPEPEPVKVDRVTAPPEPQRPQTPQFTQEETEEWTLPEPGEVEEPADAPAFDTVKAFDEWLDGEGKPDTDTLLAIREAEIAGDNRVTIVRKINRILSD